MFPSLTGAFGNEGHSLVLKPITEPLFTSEFSEFHHNFSKKITTGHQALRYCTNLPVNGIFGKRFAFSEIDHLASRMTCGIYHEALVLETNHGPNNLT